MDLSNYTVKQLKTIIQNYNLHHHIKGYSKLPRDKLETIIKEFIHFVNGSLYGISKKVAYPPERTIKPKKEVIIKPKKEEKL